MPFNKEQFSERVIAPSLKDFDLYSRSAENLILGTAAVESDFGTYLCQTGGPALGVYQVEPATHEDLYKNFLVYKKVILNKINYCFGFDIKTYVDEDGKLTILNIPDNENLVFNLKYATIICRLIYYRFPEVLPVFTDSEGLGIYWKNYYNTFAGKGTVEKFLEKYYQYVK